MAHTLRSTRVLTREGLKPASIAVQGEKIVAIQDWSDVSNPGSLTELGDLLVLPGLVDSHVHINDPGRDWEGFESASFAAAAGGVTTLIDMPLNSIPETTCSAALDAKRAAAKAKTWVDWGAWGGVVCGNAQELPDLVQAGVRGFKCFLVDSGVEGFKWVGEVDLVAALGRLTGSGLPLLVHAEIRGPIERIRPTLLSADWRAYSTYLASRPDAAETEAIELLIRMAEKYRNHLHIVHLSSAEALPMIARARALGLPLSVETCVHYLWFAAEEIQPGATEFKCAPPVRSAQNREKLWQALESGLIDLVATDHSPCPPAMKQCGEGRFDLAWGGIASLGLALPVLWTCLQKRGFGVEKAAERVGRWLSAEPARLAGLLGEKGVLAEGADADFAAFDPDQPWIVTGDDLHFRHKLSPYLGASLRGRVVETWLRGRRIYTHRRFHGEPSGRELVRR